MNRPLGREVSLFWRLQTMGYSKGSHTIFIIATISPGHPNTGIKCCMAKCATGCVRSSDKSAANWVSRSSMARCHAITSICLWKMPPHVAVSDCMRRAKGRSSRKIQQEFAHIHKRYRGQRFRGRGYFSTTSDNITDEVIENYLDKHIRTKGLSHSP